MAIWLDVAALAAIGKAVPSCPSTVAHCYAIQLHVGSDSGALVTTPEFVAGQVALANVHFASIDVAFQLAGVVEHGAPKLATRGDRDALARKRTGAPLIDVFVVGELADVDVPGAVINGVAWKVPKTQRKVILLSAKAWDRTLAHELGHFFGLPHSKYAISIMNKEPREEPPQEERTFADEEKAIMRARRKRLVLDKVIAPVKR
jgi:hypothetical protein